jgi:hypothetical protein
MFEMLMSGGMLGAVDAVLGAGGRKCWWTECWVLKNGVFDERDANC